MPFISGRIGMRRRVCAVHCLFLRTKVLVGNSNCRPKDMIEVGFNLCCAHCGVRSSAMSRSSSVHPVAVSIAMSTGSTGGLYAFADYAGVSAAAYTLPEGWLASTVGFEVHNVAPAIDQRLVAIGRAVNVGKSLGVSRTDVYAQSEDRWTLVCVATTTSKPFQLLRA